MTIHFHQPSSSPTVAVLSPPTPDTRQYLLLKSACNLCLPLPAGTACCSCGQGLPGRVFMLVAPHLSSPGTDQDCRCSRQQPQSKSSKAMPCLRVAQTCCVCRIPSTASSTSRTAERRAATSPCRWACRQSGITTPRRTTTPPTRAMTVMAQGITTRGTRTKRRSAV